MSASSSSAPQHPDTEQLPLIPCPRCLREVVSDISVGGKRPGNRYYRCVLWSSRKCGFFEWQESYRAVLQSERTRTLSPPPSPASPGMQHRTSRMEGLVESIGGPVPHASKVVAPAKATANVDFSRVALLMLASILLLLVFLLGLSVLTLAVVYFK